MALLERFYETYEGKIVSNTRNKMRGGRMRIPTPLAHVDLKNRVHYPHRLRSVEFYVIFCPSKENAVLKNHSIQKKHYKKLYIQQGRRQNFATEGTNIFLHLYLFIHNLYSYLYMLQENLFFRKNSFS
jgi:hypothetical protein